MSRTLLQLHEDDVILSLFRDRINNKLLVGTNSGKIIGIKLEDIFSQEYLSRKLIVHCKNYHNELTQMVDISLIRKMTDYVFKINREKNIVSKINTSSHSLSYSEKEFGVFTSPVLWGGSTWGWWGTLTWEQRKSFQNDEIRVLFKSAKTKEQITESKWQLIDDSANKILFGDGPYAQIRVVFEVSNSDSEVEVKSLSLPYHVKYGVVFFTSTIKLHKGSKVTGGMLTTITEIPTGTDVQWGINFNNSSKWDEYEAITPDKLFSLHGGSEFKIGAKLVSASEVNKPVIDEFAIMLDSDIKTYLNK